MAVTETIQTTVQADFFQFFVTGVGDNDPWPFHMVDGFGYEWRLWSTGGFAYVGTGGQHAVVELTVEVHDAAPGEAGLEWDHVASTSLESDGAVELRHWDPPPTPPAASLDLAPGSWRMRVHWADLAAADGPAPETVMIQLWPAPWTETTLDRCWEPWWRPEQSDTSPDGRRQIEPWVSDGKDGRFEPVGGRGGAEAVPLPGGGEIGRYARAMRDPAEGTWWVEGSDVRQVLREVTKAEAQAVMAEPAFVRIPEDVLAEWRENRGAPRDR